MYFVIFCYHVSAIWHVFSTCSISQFRLATCKCSIASHTWLAATIPDCAAEDDEKTLKVFKERGSFHFINSIVQAQHCPRHTFLVKKKKKKKTGFSLIDLTIKPRLVSWVWPKITIWQTIRNYDSLKLPPPNAVLSEVSSSYCPGNPCKIWEAQLLCWVAVWDMARILSLLKGKSSLSHPALQAQNRQERNVMEGSSHRKKTSLPEKKENKKVGNLKPKCFQELCANAGPEIQTPWPNSLLQQSY